MPQALQYSAQNPAEPVLMGPCRFFGIEKIFGIPAETRSETDPGKPVELLYMGVCGLLFVPAALLSLQKTGKNPAKSCEKTRRKMIFGRFSARHLKKNKNFFRGANPPQRPINKGFGGEAGLPETTREKFFLKKGLTMRGVCSSFLVPLEKPETVIQR